MNVAFLPLELMPIGQHQGHAGFRSSGRLKRVRALRTGCRLSATCPKPPIPRFQVARGLRRQETPFQPPGLPTARRSWAGTLLSACRDENTQGPARSRISPFRYPLFGNCLRASIPRRPQAAKTTERPVFSSCFCPVSPTDDWWAHYTMLRCNFGRRFNRITSESVMILLRCVRNKEGGRTNGVRA